MGHLQLLAEDLSVEERTLRRAAAQGTLRCQRHRPRSLRLAKGERDYLLGHWPLIANLRAALRTQRRVSLVVLYGSVARGEEDAGSDLDLLVSFADRSFAARRRLSTHLESVAERRVDLADLALVEVDAPLLLSRVLDEGRVLIDRDGSWQRLRERRRAIRARAERSYRRQMDGVAQAIEELTGA